MPPFNCHRYKMDQKQALIVEDEKNTQSLYRMLLRSEYKLHITDTKENALEILNSNPDISLVILDNDFPGGKDTSYDNNGLEVLTTALKEGNGLNAKWVPASGRVNEAYKSNYCSRGFKEEQLLNKPFKPNILYTAIETAPKGRDLLDNGTYWQNQDSQ